MELKIDKTTVRGLLIAALNLGMFRFPVNVTDVQMTQDGHFILTLEMVPKQSEAEGE